MQLFRFLIVISVVAGCYVAITLTLPYIYPLLLAALFAFIINPFVNFFQNILHFPRGLAAITVICSIFMLFIGMLFVIIMEIYQGTIFLAEKIPGYFQDFVHYVEIFYNTKILPIQESILSYFISLDSSQQDSIKNSLNELLNHIATTGSAILQESLLNIPSILSLLPNSITIFIFIILGTFLISNDWYSLKGQTQKLVPANINSSTKKIGAHLKKALGGFFRAQIILISLSGIIIFLGLVILEVEHALTIAALSTLVDLIPYVGTGIIFVPWIFYLFISGNYPLTIGLTILYMVVIISRQILEPKILSSNMGLHPLFALVGYFIGLQIWGLFGLLIAPAVLIFIQALYQTGAFRWLWAFIKG